MAIDRSGRAPRECNRSREIGAGFPTLGCELEAGPAILVCKIRMSGPEESLHRRMQTLVNWLRSCGFDQPSIMWHMCCPTHGVTTAGQFH
jgi:hypothetical protein